jgi:hypothetical protein
MLSHDTSTLEKRTPYISPAGYFEFSYSTVGGDAVSSIDISPSNGVPDYVERCAEYMNRSWAILVDTHGFTPPNLQGGRYRVSFQEMGAYGYRQISSSAPGGTVIVLHRNFMGFSANGDPDGFALGAAKVTAATAGLPHRRPRATRAFESVAWTMKTVISASSSGRSTSLSTGSRPLRRAAAFLTATQLRSNSILTHPISARVSTAPSLSFRATQRRSPLSCPSRSTSRPR